MRRARNSLIFQIIRGGRGGRGIYSSSKPSAEDAEGAELAHVFETISGLPRLVRNITPRDLKGEREPFNARSDSGTPRLTLNQLSPLQHSRRNSPRNFSKPSDRHGGIHLKATRQVLRKHGFAISAGSADLTFVRPISSADRSAKQRRYNADMGAIDRAFSQVPIIDIGPLVDGSAPQHVASEMASACGECGFFYIIGHGVDDDLQQRLEALSREFFAQSLDTKMAIRMELGGRAWRGYFPVGHELTSGKPDIKEGLYFGAEIGADHPMVKAGTPLHGPNLFPADLPEFRAVLLDYMAAMTGLGHTLMSGIALSLALDSSYFADRYTADPLILFRIFNYPSTLARADEPRWGVGEHTDYGLLTILKQDDSGGLQVKSRSEWIPAPPVPGSFVCNIGDMLDRMTGGRYRSTPHRVRNVARRDRLSFPFFFDPNYNVEVKPIDLPDAAWVSTDREERWDKASVHDFSGTYGEYVLRKVSKVFPYLSEAAAVRIDPT